MISIKYWAPFIWSECFNNWGRATLAQQQFFCVISERVWLSNKTQNFKSHQSNSVTIHWIVCKKKNTAGCVSSIICINKMLKYETIFWLLNTKLAQLLLLILPIHCSCFGVWYNSVVSVFLACFHLPRSHLSPWLVWGLLKRTEPHWNYVINYW